MTKVTIRAANQRRAPGRRWMLAGVLCLAGLVALPAAGASAASTTTEHVGGAIVRLPSDSALRKLKPGSLVKVSVRPAKKPSRQGSVAVIRLSRLVGGRTALIAQETRRVGTFSAQITPARGGRYRLAVYVGRAYTQVTFEVRFTPPPPPPGPCAEPLDVSADFGVDSSEPSPGDDVTVTLTNSGPGCLSTGYGFAWQINRNGAWVDVPLNRVVPAILLFVQPGKSVSEDFTVPKNTAPGLYRIVKRFTAAGEAVDIDTEVTVVPG
jgi:hypothetical protein